MASKDGDFVIVGNEQVSKLAWKRIREDYAKELVKKSQVDQDMTCFRCGTSLKNCSSYGFYVCYNVEYLFPCLRKWCYNCYSSYCNYGSSAQCGSDKGRQCLLLRSNYRNTDAFINEKLFQNLPRSCKNVKNGCQELLMKEDMMIHEQDCQYRPVNCAYLKCQTKAGLFNYVAHFDQTHTGQSFAGGQTYQIPFSIADTREGFNWNPVKITAFHATFFEVATVKNQHVYRWIYLLGSKDEAKNYAFHATLENKTAEGKISYNAQVQSLDVPYTEIVGKLPCFSVNVTVAQAFKIGATNELKYSVKIRCLKDEAKDEDVESGIDD